MSPRRREPYRTVGVLGSLVEPLLGSFVESLAFHVSRRIAREDVPFECESRISRNAIDRRNGGCCSNAQSGTARSLRTSPSSVVLIYRKVICGYDSIIRTMFEFVISRRRLRWEWRVCDLAGNVVAWGRESSRAAARYKAERVLFSLLLRPRIY